jgi:mono/diheme cytochrome c family protein
MKRTVPVLLILLTLGAYPGVAQRADANLTAEQRLGRQIVTQSCAVCHLPAGPGARTYGPSLNKSISFEDDNAVREIILGGTPRMPGFKYFLQPSQIDAIIAFLRTSPAPAPTATAPAQGKKDSDE